MIRTRSVRLTSALIGAVLAAPLLVPAVSASASPSTAAADGASWSVETADTRQGEGRANYAYEVDPGDVISDRLVVTNTGTGDLDLALYAADAFTTPEGVLDLRLAGDPTVDSGAWITLRAESLALAPGESAEVPFRITVPDDARPGDHPAGIVTSLLTSDAGSPLSLDRRLGMRVHLRVSGELTPAVEVRDASAEFTPSWNPFAGGTVTVSYTLANTGDTRLTASDAVALAGPLGVGGAALTPQVTAEVLPGSALAVVRTLEDVAPLGWLGGSLTVAPAAVGVGAQALDAVTVDVSAVSLSWTLLALLVLVLLVVATVVLVVARRRRRASTSSSAAPDPA